MPKASRTRTLRRMRLLKNKVQKEHGTLGVSEASPTEEPSQSMEENVSNDEASLQIDNDDAGESRTRDSEPPPVKRPKLSASNSQDDEEENERNSSLELRPVIQPLADSVLPSDQLVTFTEYNNNPPKRKRRARITDPNKPVKYSLKSLMNMDVINIDILQFLTPSTLCALFAYLDSDEISRQFTYQCRLIPARCKERCKSFGNENKAKSSMERHLHHHIQQIVSDTNKSKIKFTAESIQAKQRRLERESLPRGRQAVVKLERILTSTKELPIIEQPFKAIPEPPKAVTTSPKAQLSTKKKEKSLKPSAVVRRGGSSAISRLRDKHKDRWMATISTDLPLGVGVKTEVPKMQITERPISTSIIEVKRDETVIKQEPIEHEEVISFAHSDDVNDEERGSEVEIEVAEEEDQPPRSELLMDTDSLIFKNKEIIERVTAQLQMSKQPYLDHAYAFLIKGGKIPNPPTSYEGEDDPYYKKVPQYVYTLDNKKEWDSSADDEVDDGVVHHDLVCHYGVVGSRVSIGQFNGNNRMPLVQVYHVPQPNAPAVGEEVVIEKRALPTTKANRDRVKANKSAKVADSDESEPEPGEIKKSTKHKTVVVGTASSLHRPYPPMPKLQPEMGTKLIIPEEEMNLPLDDEDVPKEWDLTNPDHVKKYAIRCMRELKTCKGMGTRNTQVSCKICEREFTAVATLIYHYRSHATGELATSASINESNNYTKPPKAKSKNIKPFICLLCNATFTRQHSLNYHMLIHNGASRFKCPDCGRAFRHPSHFKEHQRKHTGEQPYKCPVCEMKFKTRNSFKRHLQTRHPLESAKIRKAEEEEQSRKAKEAKKQQANMTAMKKLKSLKAAKARQQKIADERKEQSKSLKANLPVKTISTLAAANASSAISSASNSEGSTVTSAAVSTNPPEKKLFKINPRKFTTLGNPPKLINADGKPLKLIPIALTTTGNGSALTNTSTGTPAKIINLIPYSTAQLNNASILKSSTTRKPILFQVQGNGQYAVMKAFHKPATTVPSTTPKVIKMSGGGAPTSKTMAGSKPPVEPVQKLPVNSTTDLKVVNSVSVPNNGVLATAKTATTMSVSMVPSSSTVKTESKPATNVTQKQSLSMEEANNTSMLFLEELNTDTNSENKN